ncbi:hypothetical protein LP419_32050 [Massilia sp. H-1]|nr:hypothetical protein LP419_32050 [Massilia sp. H-1]
MVRLRPGRLSLIPAALLGVVSPSGSASVTAPVTALKHRRRFLLSLLPTASLLPPVTTGVAAEAAAKPADPLPPVISNAVPLISVPPPSTPSSSAPGAGSPSGIAPVMPVAPAAVVAAPQAATAAAGRCRQLERAGADRA